MAGKFVCKEIDSEIKTLKITLNNRDVTESIQGIEEILKKSGAEYKLDVSQIHADKVVVKKNGLVWNASYNNSVNNTVFLGCFKSGYNRLQIFPQTIVEDEFASIDPDQYLEQQADGSYIEPDHLMANSETEDFINLWSKYYLKTNSEYYPFLTTAASSYGDFSWFGFEVEFENIHSIDVTQGGVLPRFTESSGYGQNKKIFLNVNTGFQSAVFDGDQLPTLIARRVENGDMFQGESYNLNPVLQNVRKSGTEKTLESYGRNYNTLIKKYETFKYANHMWMGSQERLDWISSVPTGVGSGSSSFPIANTSSTETAREWGTVSQAEFIEITEKMAKDGFKLESSRVKSVKNDWLKDHFQILYEPNMSLLPLNGENEPQYIKNSGIDKMQLFPWGSFIKLSGSTVPEEMKDFELLVSNRRTREQKRPGRQQGTTSTLVWDDFCEIGIKYPIHIPSDRSFEFELNGVLGSVTVKSGNYYISQLVEVIDKGIDQKKVKVKFNYQQNTTNMISVEVEPGNTFKIIMSDNDYYGEIPSAFDLQIHRILGFTKNPTSAVNTDLYISGSKYDQFYKTSRASLSQHAFIPKTVEEYANLDIYTDRYSARNKYEEINNEVNFLAVGIGIYKASWVIQDIKIKNSTSFTQFNTIEKWNTQFEEVNGEYVLKQTAIDNLLNIEIDVINRTDENFNPLGTQTLTVKKVEKGGNGRYAIELGLLKHQFISDFPEEMHLKILEQLNNGYEVGCSLAQYQEAVGVNPEIIVKNTGRFLYGSNTFAGGGFYLIGYRMFLVLGKYNEEPATEFIFYQEGDYCRFYYDAFCVLDSADNPFVAAELNGHTSSNPNPQAVEQYGQPAYPSGVVYAGYNMATALYDGYVGTFQTGDYYRQDSIDPHPTDWAFVDKYVWGVSGVEQAQRESISTTRIIDGEDVVFDSFDYTKVEGLVIGLNYDENVLVSNTSVITSLLSPEIKNDLENIDLSDVKVSKTISPLTNYMNLDEYNVLCFHTQSYIVSEEHAYMEPVVEEQGDGVSSYLKIPYSQVENKFRRGGARSTFDGGNLTTIMNAPNFHALNEGDAMVTGTDFGKEFVRDPSDSTYWRFPEHMQITEAECDEISSTHYCGSNVDYNGLKPNGMNMYGKQYRTIYTFLEEIYDIHCHDIIVNNSLPEHTLGSTFGIAGHGTNERGPAAELMYRKFYGWPLFANNQDTIDVSRKSEATARQNSPKYGKFRDSVILELMKNNAKFMEEYNTTGVIPKVGYYVQGNVVWAALFRTTSNTYITLCRPDRDFAHSNNFFDAISEPVIQYFSDNDIRYIYMDERSQLGGYVQEAETLFNRIGTKGTRPRFRSYGLNKMNNWEPRNNKKSGDTLMTHETSDFNKMVFDLSRFAADPTNYGIQNKGTNLYDNSKIATWDNFENSIMSFNPEEIAQNMPVLSNPSDLTSIVGPGPTITGTAEKPLRILCHRSTYSTSGGRYCGQIGCGRYGDCKLGNDYTTFRQIGNFDRLFATAGGYGPDVWAMQNDDSTNSEPNSHDIMGVITRYEPWGRTHLDQNKYMDASGNVDYDSIDYTDKNNYVWGTSSWETNQNQVDFVAENDMLTTFWHSIGLNKEAVERLSIRTEHIIPVINNAINYQGNIDAESDYIFESNSDFTVGITFKGYQNDTDRFLVKTENVLGVVRKHFVIGKDCVGCTISIGNQDYVVSPATQYFTLLQASWVEKMVGMQGIDNINFNALPFSKNDEVIFENPLTHIDYFAARSLQILLDHSLDSNGVENWTSKSQRLNKNSFSTEQTKNETIRYGGLSVERYTGDAPEGNKYPSSLQDLPQTLNPYTNSMYESGTTIFKPEYGIDLSDIPFSSANLSSRVVASQVRPGTNLNKVSMNKKKSTGQGFNNTNSRKILKDSLIPQGFSLRKSYADNYLGLGSNIKLACMGLE